MDGIENIVFMDDDSFVDYIGQDKITLLHFLSGSHVECRRQIPYIKRFAEKHGDKYTIGVIDVTRSPAAAMSCRIKGIPNMVILRKGVMFGGYRGSLVDVDEQQLLQRLGEIESKPIKEEDLVY